MTVQTVCIGLQHEGDAPESFLFLDDGPKNIAAAESLGIRSILIDPREKLDFLLNISEE